MDMCIIRGVLQRIPCSAAFYFVQRFYEYEMKLSLLISRFVLLRSSF